MGRAACPVAGRSFHPFGAEFAADFTQTNLLFVVEIAVLEDDLYLLASGVSDVDDGSDVFSHIIPVAAQHLRNVGDHVEFLAAVGDRPFRFRPLDGRRVTTMREADRGRSLHRAPCQKLGTAFQIVGQDTNAGDVISQCELNPCFKIVDRQCRIQEGMVDHLGHVFVGVTHRKLQLASVAFQSTSFGDPK